MKLEESPESECGEDEEIAIHVLIECPCTQETSGSISEEPLYDKK